jgi:hypothetical protein
MAVRQFVSIPAKDLQVGDLLQGDKKGTIIPIKSLTLGRGCRNIHVNNMMCFDRAGFATVAV